MHRDGGKVQKVFNRRAGRHYTCSVIVYKLAVTDRYIGNSVSVLVPVWYRKLIRTRLGV